MTMPIRVFVVDDHALFRDGLLRLLDGDAAMTVVGSADSAETALEAVPRADVDVVILDYDLGPRKAQYVVAGLRDRGFRGRSLVVTAGLPDTDAVDLLRLGVGGIFLKRDSPRELQRHIREVAAGRVLIDQRHFRSLATPSSPEPDGAIVLTEREQSVLRLLLEGRSNKQIAAALHVSESAAKATLQQLFGKTGVRTRSQLVRIALETNIASQPMAVPDGKDAHDEP